MASNACSKQPATRILSCARQSPIFLDATRCALGLSHNKSGSTTAISSAMAILNRKFHNNIRGAFQPHIPHLIAEKDYQFVGFPPLTLRDLIQNFYRVERTRMPAPGYEKEYLNSLSAKERARFDESVVNQEGFRLKQEALCQKAARRKATRERQKLRRNQREARNVG